MDPRRVAAAPALFALAAGLTVIPGCTGPISRVVEVNQPPTVRITSAPLDTTQRNYYVITINWIGFDPDGRVDHFLTAIDPPKDPGSDTVWTTTTSNTMTRSFPCPLPDRRTGIAVDNGDTTYTNSSDFHVFVIKAVDNLGAMSPPVSRAFWSYTVAPTVEVRVPPANSLVRYYLPPAVLFQWEGHDPDGVFTQRPVKYKFTMLTGNTPVTFQSARAHPDSVRLYYAPRAWAGWDSVGGDTTQKQYTNLTPESDNVFVVVAFDETGAYSPIFSFDENMIYFRATFSGAQNPRIGIYNDFFSYEYPQGSFCPTCASQIVHVAVPAANGPDDRLTFNWYANPASDARGNPLGGPMRSYRWAVDISDLEDETPRDDEATDLRHWSQKSILTTSCRIGPYTGNQTHKFYLEAEDIDRLVSLGTVEFSTVQATFDKPLLVVNDTRLQLDHIAIGTNCFSPSNAPNGAWPTAAELDTFLFAVGGMPWRCYPPPPPAPPVLSTPGLFHAYLFDTVSTRIGAPDLTVPLKTLGRYQHVIWLVDAKAVRADGQATDVLECPTALRFMNANGRANTLAAYARQGGLVWLAGGGAATASLINFNNGSNDGLLPNPRTLTFSSANGELIPGRFMYDQAHWRSELKQFPVSGGRLRRYLGRFESSPGPYGALPPEIQMKSPATDPFPPNRGQPASNFYQQQFDVEFLSAENDILEDVDPGPLERFESTLDTLYKVTGAQLLPDTGRAGLQSVVMTDYHGLDNREFVFTGFNLWNFRRSQCQALVDFVLQDLWGLSEVSTPPGGAAKESRLPGPSSALRALPPVGETAAPVAPGSPPERGTPSLSRSNPTARQRNPAALAKGERP